mgnify:FL=1
MSFGGEKIQKGFAYVGHRQFGQMGGACVHGDERVGKALIRGDQRWTDLRRHSFGEQARIIGFHLRTDDWCGRKTRTLPNGYTRGFYSKRLG